MISNSCSGIFGLRFAIKTLLWQFLRLLFIINFVLGFKTKAKERKGGWKEKRRVKWLPPRKVAYHVYFCSKLLPSYLIWFVFFFLLNKADFPVFIGRYWIRAKDIKEWERKMLNSFTILFWITSCNCCISWNVKNYISRGLILLDQNNQMFCF